LQIQKKLYLPHSCGMSNGCSESVRGSIADAYRSIAVAVFGMGSRDKIHLAEMSLSASIADIAAAEQKTKDELTVLVRRIREIDPAKQRGQAQEILSRSRMLRATMSNMSKKKNGMQLQLETLGQSQLNQNMLQSMKHTNEALQTLGFKAGDADTIMLDLEDSTSDINSLTNTLSGSFMDESCSYEDFEAEYALMLSEDALSVVPVKPKLQKPALQEQNAVVVVVPQLPNAPDDFGDAPGDDSGDAALDEQQRLAVEPQCSFVSS